MEDVKDLSVELTKWHKYSPQYKVELTKNGNKMDRTVVMNYPSVAVVIFNKTRQKLVLIKQFRLQHMFASIRENVSEPSAVDHQKMNEICKGNYHLIKYHYSAKTWVGNCPLCPPIIYTHVVKKFLLD